MQNTIILNIRLFFLFLYEWLYPLNQFKDMRIGNSFERIQSWQHNRSLRFILIETASLWWSFAVIFAGFGDYAEHTLNNVLLAATLYVCVSILVPMGFVLFITFIFLHHFENIQ